MDPLLEKVVHRGMSRKDKAAGNIKIYHTVRKMADSLHISESCIHHFSLGLQTEKVMQQACMFASMCIMEEAMRDKFQEGKIWHLINTC